MQEGQVNSICHLKFVYAANIAHMFVQLQHANSCWLATERHSLSAPAAGTLPSQLVAVF